MTFTIDFQGRKYVPLADHEAVKHELQTAVRDLEKAYDELAGLQKAIREATDS